MAQQDDCWAASGERPGRPFISPALPGDRGQHQTLAAAGLLTLQRRMTHGRDERRFLSGSSEWASIASKGHVRFYNLLLVSDSRYRHFQAISN